MILEIHNLMPIPGFFLAPQIDAFFADEPELCRFLKELSKEGDILKDGMITDCKQSIKTGLPFSSLLDNLYLRSLDQLIERKGFFYLRYCDDILISGERKEDLKLLLEEMTETAESSVPRNSLNSSRGYFPATEKR